MNREYNSRVSSKNSERLLKNLQNTTGDYFFLPHPVVQFGIWLYYCIKSKETLFWKRCILYAPAQCDSDNTIWAYATPTLLCFFNYMICSAIYDISDFLFTCISVMCNQSSHLIIC